MSGAPGPVLVFDSGMGGLTVVAAIRRSDPDLDCVLVADDERFPYGALAEPVLVERVASLIDRLIAAHRPSLVVIACNSASTLVLPTLRARFDLPFVGTVPAIKPAAAATRSRRISVLATPGTAARDYTRDLIDRFAAGCDVTLVGASTLAGEAEKCLAGAAIDAAAVRFEITPAFVDEGGRRTDTIVLACTHYPLILDELIRAAPWQVNWIDPAPAIARRVVSVLGEGGLGGRGGCGMVMTSGRAPPARARSVLDDLIARQPFEPALTGRGAPAR